ncbi:MAG: NAD(P)-binding domain-containing protein [Betaproteobacteria bacterium]
MSGYPQTERTGLIGLGTMGLPMACNLARALREVLVFDIREDRIAAAVMGSGVRAAASVADIAASCGLVFTCLPSVEAILQVHLGQGGLLNGARGGQIVCELSTKDQDLSIEIGDQFERRGAAYLER